MKKVIFIILSVFIYASCNQGREAKSDMDNIDLNKIELLRLSPSKGEVAYMEALLIGKVYIDGACIKILSENNISYTPIWPAHFLLGRENGDIVIKEGNRLVGAVSKKISIAGGELRSIDHLNMDLPKLCQSTLYWLVSPS